MFHLMRNKCRYHFCVAICLGLAGLANTFAAPPEPLSPPMRYASPEVTFDGGNQLQLLRDEIDKKQLPTAVARLDALLRDDSDSLLSQGDDASVLSIGSWVENLPPETKTLLRPSYEEAIGRAAQQALEEAQAKPDTDPAEFYELARRYPLSRAACAALAQAARQSALLGDVPTAHWMLDAATAGGWLPDPSLQHEIDRSLAKANNYSGSLPFAASWYGSRTRQAWAAIRSFPATAGDVIFVVGPGQVIAMKGNGAVLWQGPAGAQPNPGQGASAPMGVTRGPPFSPAILCDAAGAPQLLVVRQPEVHGTGWALRALRASDGHLLWTTEGQDDYGGLVFGSNPAVEGRYVYAIAGEVADQLDHLSLVAIEVTTGRQLWRCDIGTESRTIAPRPRNQPPAEVYRPWLNESAPAVCGDLVITSPNVGAVIAVGRFDGKLRWTRGYQTLSDPTYELQRQRDWALEHPTSIPPLASGLSLRWANTPAVSGDAVVTAPEDSDQVLAVNILDGKPLWQSSYLSDATLVGVSGPMAVMEGETIAAIRVANGAIAWKETEPIIVGPAIVRGINILAPTAAGVAVLSAQTGSAAASSEKIPSFEAASAAEPAREVLLENDVAHCFGIDVGRSDNRFQRGGGYGQFDVRP